MSTAHPIDRIRNIGIVAHIDAGKTTLTERILFYSGRTYRLGEVDEGTTVTDWMEQERERGITITAAAVTTAWRDSVTGEEAQINLIDTPGHIDFTAEVQRSLRVLDGGVVVFDAVAGVEPQSETVWRQADQYGVPRICFINKMDRPGADLEHSIQTIRDRLGAAPLPVQIPIGSGDEFVGVVDLIEMHALTFAGTPGSAPTVGRVPPGLADTARAARESMVARIVDTDDALTAQFVEGREIPNRELYRALRRAVLTNQLVPVLIGSALRNRGLQPLLDAIVRYLPSPLEIPAVRGIQPDTGQQVVRHASGEEPFCALLFKILTDPYVGRLAYVRVYSGTMQARRTLYNATRQRRERVSRLFRMYADKRERITACTAGDIAAVVGLKDSFTGDTLCDPASQILLETIRFPQPVIQMAIRPQVEGERERLVRALRKLAEEDPTLRVGYDEQTRQLTISGMGELHLEIVADRVAREFGVPAAAGLPEVAYRETITKTARAQGRYIHQTGGRGQYGVVWLELAPNLPGGGFAFENRTNELAIPAPFIPAIQRGVTQVLEEGLLAGYPITDIRVTVVDGKHHEVDSSKMAFEIAASLAFKEAFPLAGPILLEPIVRVEVRAPEHLLGPIANDLSARGGTIEGVEHSQRTCLARATVPLRTMLGYVTDLRSLTSGRGTFTMELQRYAPVPETAAAEIIHAAEKRRQ